MIAAASVFVMTPSRLHQASPRDSMQAPFDR
jgi:hypothetical protein